MLENLQTRDYTGETSGRSRLDAVASSTESVLVRSLDGSRMVEVISRSDRR